MGDSNAAALAPAETDDEFLARTMGDVNSNAAALAPAETDEEFLARMEAEDAAAFQNAVCAWREERAAGGGQATVVERSGGFGPAQGKDYAEADDADDADHAEADHDARSGSPTTVPARGEESTACGDAAGSNAGAEAATVLTSDWTNTSASAPTHDSHTHAPVDAALTTTDTAGAVHGEAGHIEASMQAMSLQPPSATLHHTNKPQASTKAATEAADHSQSSKSSAEAGGQNRGENSADGADGSGLLRLVTNEISKKADPGDQGTNSKYVSIGRPTTCRSWAFVRRHARGCVCV